MKISSALNLKSLFLTRIWVDLQGVFVHRRVLEEPVVRVEHVLGQLVKPFSERIYVLLDFLILIMSSYSPYVTLYILGKEGVRYFYKWPGYWYLQFWLLSDCM